MNEIVVAILIAVAALPIPGALAVFLRRRDPPLWLWLLPGWLVISAGCVLTFAPRFWREETYLLHLGVVLACASWGSAALAWSVAAVLRPGPSHTAFWRPGLSLWVVGIGALLPAAISGEGDSQEVLSFLALVALLAGLPASARIGERTDRVWRWVTVLALLAGAQLVTLRLCAAVGPQDVQEDFGLGVRDAIRLAALGTLAAMAWWQAGWDELYSQRMALVVAAVVFVAPAAIEDRYWAGKQDHVSVPGRKDLAFVDLGGHGPRKGLLVHAACVLDTCIWGHADTRFADAVAHRLWGITLAVPSGRSWPRAHAYDGLGFPLGSYGLFVTQAESGGLKLPGGVVVPLTEAALPRLTARAVRASTGLPRPTLLLDPRGTWALQDIVSLCLSLSHEVDCGIARLRTLNDDYTTTPPHRTPR